MFHALLPMNQDCPGALNDLLFKISVLQANFCRLGDMEEIICPWKESVAGEKCADVIYIRNLSSLLYPPPSPSNERVNSAL